MRLLSWNIKAAESPGSRHVPNLERIAAVIDEQRPDIVCLQETALGSDDGADSFRTLRKLLGMDGRLQSGQRTESRATAVLWRSDTAGLRQQATHYTGFYHSAAIVALNVTGLSTPLTVASIHLHPHSADARVIEASVFHMKADKGQLTVLAGDFNGLGAHDPEPSWADTRPGNRASRCLPAPLGTPVEDLRGDRRVAWNLATAGYTDACLGPEYEKTASHIRVDWALLSQALAPALTGYRVAEHSDLSDHKPIVVDLELLLIG
ncbi:endonuclease/exonuclease/phosphatase family metal-dependent hydrolase [Catenulispora sp. GAS73]|uniref:endonuclease/exonuclease/phosphatase family protein n=1 Tax=Catenulispora sp. GAS73 TaxID=3156269 RepID=UPI0035164270